MSMRIYDTNFTYMYLVRALMQKTWRTRLDGVRATAFCVPVICFSLGCVFRPLFDTKVELFTETFTNTRSADRVDET